MADNIIQLTKYRLTNENGNGFWHMEESYDGQWYRDVDVAKLFNRIAVLEQLNRKLRLRCEYLDNIIGSGASQN